MQKQRFLPNVSGKRVSSQEPFRTMNHYMLKGNDDKLFPIIAFCIFTLQRNSVSPQHLAQMLGGWTWFLLINRPLLSIFDAVYSFQNIYWNDRFSEIELWPSVRCELHCVLGMLPFMEASLSLEWGEVAYEVDAGPKRTSVLTSPAPASTLRVLAQLAERGGWLLNDLHADADPDLLAHAIEDGLSSASPGFSKEFARFYLVLLRNQLKWTHLGGTRAGGSLNFLMC